MVVALGEAVHQVCSLGSQLCVNSLVPGVRGKVPAGQIVRGCLTICQIYPQGCQKCGQDGGHSVSASLLPQIGLAFCAADKTSQKVIINKPVQTVGGKFFHNCLQSFTNVLLLSVITTLKITKIIKYYFHTLNYPQIKANEMLRCLYSSIFPP